LEHVNSRCRKVIKRRHLLVRSRWHPSSYPLVQRYGRLVFCSSASILTSKLIVLVDSQSYFGRNSSLASWSSQPPKHLLRLVSLPVELFWVFLNTAPQVIGLTVIHDMFFFQERTRKINLWAFTYLVGPYLGPFIAGFLIQNINWRQDIGVLAAFYGFSTHDYLLW